MNAAVVLSCLILGVSAYNFDDAVYNQFLVKDFESLADDDGIAALHPRARRDEQASKCPKPHTVCCGGEVIDAMHKELRDVNKQCFKEVTGHEFFHAKPFDPFNCEDIEKRKKDMLCVKQCVGQKKEFVDEKGNLKEDLVRKYITENNPLDWIKPQLAEILTKCFAEAKQATAEMDKSDKDACNPANLKFNHCLFREVQLSCPAEKIEDPKRCEIIRQFAKHSSFFLPHIPPY